MQTDHCLGTYIHGFLDNQPVIDYLLGSKQPVSVMDAAAFKDEQYNKLADHVRQHVDMERIYQILTSDD
jgi:adenosylcobyric acid synthase